MFCRTCRGPVPAGRARCYQCDRALSQVGELLADTVAVAGYAVRGGQLATDLWRYKSDCADAAECGARLRGRLAAFLREQADSVWHAAGMTAGPSAAAVVPSGRGRAGGHPLTGIVRACLDLPQARLAIAPEHAAHARGVDPCWLRAADPVAGADILVVDDTWVSGGSAQSAAAALKLAGARRVAIIVIGRHVNPDDPRSAAFLAALRDSSFAQQVPARRGAHRAG